MSFFSRKKGSKSRGLESPAYDPYKQYQNTGNGIFGFRKDKHVVMPGVASYEENALFKVKDYVQKKTGKPCTLSQELINDVYSIYVNKDFKMRPETSQNGLRHKVLNKVYDSLTKIVTTDSPLFTQILTRELALVLQKVDDDVRQEQSKSQKDGDPDPQGLESQSGPEDGQENPNEGDEGGEGGSQEGSNSQDDSNQNESNDGGDKNGQGQSQESQDSSSGKDSSGSSDGDQTRQIVENALEKATESIEKAKDDADKKIKDLEDQLGKEAIKDLMSNDPEFLEKIDELKDKLRSVSVNKESIKKVMEKILNESMNYFSAKFKRVEESLFDCEECEDLFGLEFLHPIFKNSEIMSVGNESRIYKGKIDLYLDCSLSMNSSEIFEGTSIRMIDLVKGIAMVLFRMGMIENLYFFDNHLYKIESINEISILSFSKSGGTNFNRVVKKVKENGNNSVVITDGFDACNDYDKKVFWIGVGGTTFNRNDAFKSYRSNKQCVAYNSVTSKFDYCKSL